MVSKYKQQSQLKTQDLIEKLIKYETGLQVS